MGLPGEHTGPSPDGPLLAGLYPAKVTKLQDDPLGLQRIQVSLDWMTSNDGSGPPVRLVNLTGLDDEGMGSAGSGGQDDDGELDPLESLGTEEHQYEVSEDRAVLAPGFRVLDERERKILHLRFFEGLTQSQIAQQVGISQMHVSRLIRRSLEKIRNEIAAEQSA